MSFYQKYLIAAAIFGIVGIPIFVLDLKNLSWDANREVYWGMISLIAIIVTVVVQYKASQKSKREGLKSRKKTRI